MEYQVQEFRTNQAGGESKGARTKARGVSKEQKGAFVCTLRENRKNEQVNQRE
ncbi:hypothetical protein WH47_05009 [Habropoda laboriosa]|uniref:Uncharacterized protein n=1 Tax=Habropoda laboriosa TaxID=597456 RepID=A0A0L7RJP8_9HYME|nr:hypothetical protein WH47_05009 [Habropoda laboriosa]